MIKVVELFIRYADIVWTITILICGVYKAAGSNVFYEYSLHNGWVAENTTGQLTMLSATQCAAYTLVPGNSVYPLATYNKTTSSCKTIEVQVPQNVYLHNTGDDKDVVLMRESICKPLVHVFKVHTDTDYFGNDYPYGSQKSTIDDCASYCDQMYVEFKAIAFNDMSLGLNCWCKKVTPQQHIELGGSIRVLPGWNYYERLC